MILASLLHGRLRVRDEGLKRDELADQVTDALLADPGVSTAEVNPRVGSLLVVYDAAQVGTERVLEMISSVLGPVEGAEQEAGEAQKPFSRACCGGMSLSIPPAVRRKVVNLGMLASLALSVAAAIFDFKKLHIFAGIVFLALFGDHFFQRREAMFA